MNDYLNDLAALKSKHRKLGLGRDEILTGLTIAIVTETDVSTEESRKRALKLLTFGLQTMMHVVAKCEQEDVRDYPFSNGSN